jgi:hypothetical protein
MEASVEDFVSTIQAAQELLEGGQGAASLERPSKKALGQVAERLKGDVAKGESRAVPRGRSRGPMRLTRRIPGAVGILFGAAAPAASEATSLLAGVQQSAIGVFACCQALAADSCGTLRKELAAAGKRISEPLLALVHALVSGPLEARQARWLPAARLRPPRRH